MIHESRIRGPHLQGSEVSWFAPICGDDYRYLGQAQQEYKSTFYHTREVLLKAEENGFRNILCPTSFQVGQDALAFAAGVAPETSTINLLLAVRCGEYHPPMLARYIASLDHILRGRLTINIISSDLPGENLDSQSRYMRSREVIQILKQAFMQERIDFQGKFYQLKVPDTSPAKPFQQNGGPMFYFGGYSPYALDLCAEFCDVYLLWPNKEEILEQQIAKLSSLAWEKYGRKLDYGLRVHVIVRESEREAKAYAQSLLSKLDLAQGTKIRNRAQDSNSLGVGLQSNLRDTADVHGYAEDHLWTGIGLARSGCGAALVGTPDQIIKKINTYQEMGFRSFIFSGYPHAQECDLFSEYVLPHLKTISLPQAYGRIPEEDPDTPLKEVDLTRINNAPLDSRSHAATEV